jgi:hypothetical protein
MMLAKYRLHLLQQRLANRKYRADSKKRHRLIVWPRIRKWEELEDVVNWLAWYLPEKSGLTVTVLVSRSLGKGPETWDADVQKNVNLLSGELRGELIDAVLVYKNTLWNSFNALVAFNAKLDSIDKHFFGVHESLAFERIYQSHDTKQLARMRSELDRTSQANYRALYDRYKSCRRAFVLGTGPSLQMALSMDFSPDDLVIGCNSIVKNEKILIHTRPGVIAFADQVFHFGRSNYAKQFRADLLRAVRRLGCFCIVPPERGLLLAMHFPEVASRLIAMPFNGTFNLPTPGNRKVKVTENVMTLYMLPIASAIAKEIYIVGADGREQRERYFWKHDETAQYGELLSSVREAHPSFFRDRNYNAYYEEHCRTLEELMRYGENHGVTYSSLTPSRIPALAKRSQKGGI